jgi:hypothetical protein
MIDVDAFESAYVAVSYLLGRRDALFAGLPAPGAAAHRAALSLSSSERTERAMALSRELSPIAAELAARSVA